MYFTRWSQVRQIAEVTLFIMFAACVSRLCEALAFNHKELESSSQIWSGHHLITNKLEASFEDCTPQNITALVGDSASLPCTVYHLDDRSVTWMRRRDLHILTAGIYTYSADERFMVLHPDSTNDWTLHIKYVTMKDAGVYECQVNSDPKMSRTVILNVIESQLDDPGPYGISVSDTRFPDYIFDYNESQQKEHKKDVKHVPVVVIEGPEERHIQRGSVLAVTCVVHHPPKQAPDHIVWFHGTNNVDYDSPRGGVSIQTEKSLRKTVSKLLLSTVDSSDTGAYSCSPTGLQPAQIFVYVQEGQIQLPVKQDLGFNEAPRVSVFTTSLVLLPVMTQVCNTNWNFGA